MPTPTKPKRKAYLASSSRGDRDLLRYVSEELAKKGYMVFTPCLAFTGLETPEIRPAILRICFDTVITWSETFFILDEGIESDGVEAERKISLSQGIPIWQIKKESLGESLNQIATL